MKKILTLMALLMAFTVNGLAKDITIYVHSSEQPSIYAWNSDGVLTSGFPGNGMAWAYWTSGKNLWKYTFENQSSINVIFSYGGHQTANIEGVTEDTYYDFDPSNGSYQVLENSSVDQVALPGSFNSWNQNFFLTKGTGNTWTTELDLTETTADVTFKSIIFAGSNNTWLGYNSPGILFSAPDGWLVDDDTDNHNIKLKNSTTGYQTYTVTLTWEENPFYSSNWTISVEGKDKRVSYDEIPLMMEGAALVSTEFDGYNDDVIVKLTISNNTESELGAYASRNGWEIGRITNVDSWESNDYMITLSGKDGVEFDIFTTVGALKNAAKLGTDEYIEGQYHPQGGVTINVYNNCSLKSVSILVPIVSSAKLLGSWDEWGDGLTLTKTADSYEWTGTLDLTEIDSNAKFKLLVNGESWLGSTQVALAEGTEDLVSVGGAGSNLTLNNSDSGYATYNVTATWTISNSVAAGWTLKIEGKDERIAEITSLVIKAAGQEINFAGYGEENVYSKTFDLSMIPEQYASITTIPFQLFVNESETAIPIDNITIDATGTPGLLVKGTTPFADYLIINREASLGPVYEAIATWTPSSDATAGWTLKLVSRSEIYSVIYKEGDNEWAIGDEMTESEGVFTATFRNKPGMLFAIAPSVALEGTAITWSKVVRPQTEGENWKIEFADYNGTTESAAEGKVWAIDAANTADVIINFTPGDETSTFTITNELEFTIGQYGYSTYSNAKKYKVVDATANFVTVSGSEATLVAQADGAVLPAMTGAGKGSGIIISGDAGAKAIIKSANQSDDAVDNSANLLAGSGDNTYDIGTQFSGGDEYTAYIFTKPEGKDLGFYKLDPSQGTTLAAHKAFLAIPNNQNAPSFIGFGGTTGINNVERGMLNVEGCYTLDGRRVENPTKGLYIINGKKVVLK